MEYLLQLIIVLGWVICLFGLGCFYFIQKRTPKQNFIGPHRPKVSWIKACYDNVDNEIENFDALFNQNYEGPLEIFFTVPHEQAPIVPIIKHYLNKYPLKQAQLVVSKSRNSVNRKVDALSDAYKIISGEIVIFSDSDVVVKNNYIQDVVQTLQNNPQCLITTPQIDFRANNWICAIKALGNNADVAILISIFDLFTSVKKAAWGHAMSFWKKDFDKIAGQIWQELNLFIADDQGLPFVFSKNGLQVKFVNHFCPVEYSSKTFKNMIDQKRRHISCQVAGLGHRILTLLAFLFYPFFTSTFLLICYPSANSFLFFGVSAILRVMASILHEWTMFHNLEMNKRFPLAVLSWDLLQIYFLFYALTSRFVIYHGIKYRIKNRYYLEKVETR